MESEEVENLIENDKDFKEGIDQVNINLKNDDINEIPLLYIIRYNFKQKYQSIIFKIKIYLKKL